MHHTKSAMNLEVQTYQFYYCKLKAANGSNQITPKLKGQYTI